MAMPEIRHGGTMKRAFYQLRGVVSFWGAVGLLALGTVSVVQAGSPCPDTLRGQFTSGNYRFEYQSWSWKAADGSKSQLYCHCVRNKSRDQALWVDWKETGLETFVAPGFTSYAFFSYASGVENHKQVPLWYGARPDKLDVQIVFNKQNDASAISPSSSASTTATGADSGYGRPRRGAHVAPHTPGSLESEAVIALPDVTQIERLEGASASKLGRSKIIEIVQAHPELLSPMNMGRDRRRAWDLHQLPA
jgi:hypothetical protein